MSNWYSSFWFDKKTSVDDILAKYDNNNDVDYPNINTNYQATNILLETKKKPTIKEIINLIIFSYEKFFFNINSYNYTNFKKKAELMILN